MRQHTSDNQRLSLLAGLAILASALVVLLVPAWAGADQVPSNDSFASAQVLTGASGSVIGSNVGATSEIGEPQIANGNSIWYQWQAPADGPTTFDTRGSNFDTVLAVYTGTDLSNLTLVALNDDYYFLQSRVDFQATAGTKYYIQVDGFPDVSFDGTVVLNWELTSPPPPPPTFNSFPSSLTSSTSASFSFADASASATFLCSLDNSAYSACTSPQSYSGLADGPHTFLVAATSSGGRTSSPTAFSWTVDTTPPPPPAIDSHPRAATTSTSASFTFSDTEAGAGLLCSLDGAAFGACTSPQSFSALAEGPHSFAVEATDAVGNTSSATTFNWTIDLTPPPAPAIGSSPAALTNSTSAAFSFSDGDAGASFQCSLDGAPYTACSSPQTYSGLAEGPHTFAVSATDAAGNTSSATTFNWTIDLTPPPAPAIGAHPDAGTVLTSATFTFTDSEAGTSSICSLDGAPYAPCASPQGYVGLANGTHTFAVKAVDAAGNAGAAATFSWLIDTNPRPAPTIDSHPNVVVASRSATFAFSDTLPAATFLCSLDGQSYAACTSPQTYSGLADGLHTFAVKAVDVLGIATDATAFSWTVDTTPRPVPTIASHPDALTTSTTASFSFSDTLAGGTFFCSLDGAASTSCTSPQSYSGLADGQHSFAVYVQDVYGIRSDAATFGWTVDTTPPPAPSIDSHPSSITNSATASFHFSDADTGASFLCSLDGAAYTSCTGSQSYGSLAEGQHLLSVKAKDAAGNVGGATTFAWTVDLTPPPAATITSSPDAITSATSATLVFSDSEPGVTFLCSLDGAAASVCTSPKTFTGLSGGAHTFSVSAKDVAGNLGASVSFRWTDPRGAKRDALATLQGLPAASDKETDRELRQAISTLQKALDPSLWIDGSHLAGNSGQVFEKEKSAVDELQELIAGGQFDRPTLQIVVNNLVTADRVLARTAIAESTDPKRIADAQTELSRGDILGLAGKPVDAIEHYKNAWKKAR